MQPIGMEMQAEVEMEQSAAAGSGAFAEEYAAAAESRKYWFDRKKYCAPSGSTGWAGVRKTFSFPCWP